MPCSHTDLVAKGQTGALFLYLHAEGACSADCFDIRGLKTEGRLRVSAFDRELVDDQLSEQLRLAAASYEVVEN
jgi:hypothetical protein